MKQSELAAAHFDQISSALVRVEMYVCHTEEYNKRLKELLAVEIRSLRDQDVWQAPVLVQILGFITKQEELVKNEHNKTKTTNDSDG